MIRRGVAVGLAAVGAAWLAEGVLARRVAAGEPDPLDPIVSRVVIDAPIEEVWAEIADIPGQVRWMREMKAVRVLTPGAVGPGTRAIATVRILGLAVTDPVEVTAWDPPRRFAIRHEGRFGGSGEFALEPGADGRTTIVTWRERLVAPFLPRLWALSARPVLGRVFQGDLHLLRRLLEE